METIVTNTTFFAPLENLFSDTAEAVQTNATIIALAVQSGAEVFYEKTVEVIDAAIDFVANLASYPHAAMNYLTFGYSVGYRIVGLGVSAFVNGFILNTVLMLGAAALIILVGPTIGSAIYLVMLAIGYCGILRSNVRALMDIQRADIDAQLRDCVAGSSETFRQAFEAALKSGGKGKKAITKTTKA